MEHHRKSIRYKGYDYSKNGMYFITICTKDKLCLFGDIVDGKMLLNNNGKIVNDEWLNTINIRGDDVKLHEYVVMPNHMHTIVEITNNHIYNNKLGVCDTPLRSTSKTLGAIIRGFKGAVSKQIGKSIWQRNYYEHIIRDYESYINITNYIKNNPLKWK